MLSTSSSGCSASSWRAGGEVGERARLGGLGSVAGNGNSSTLIYNFGGAAAGIDYRVDPRFLIGNQWVDSFMGRGWRLTFSKDAL